MHILGHCRMEELLIVYGKYQFTEPGYLFLQLQCYCLRAIWRHGTMCTVMCSRFPEVIMHIRKLSFIHCFYDNFKIIEVPQALNKIVISRKESWNIAPDRDSGTVWPKADIQIQSLLFLSFIKSLLCYNIILNLQNYFFLLIY